MFMTQDEVEDMTGLVQGAAQIRWLERNGLRRDVDFKVRSDGKPRVLASAIQPKAPPPSRRPNFSALGLRQ